MAPAQVLYVWGMALPRVPLPVKLLLSYLCIVVIGAGPTFYYVRGPLQNDLLADATTHLLGRARRTARLLGGLSDAERPRGLAALSASQLERLTYLSPHGDVLYDSALNPSERPATVENHGERPEIQRALGVRSVALPAFALPIVGEDEVGVARRVSATSGIDTLYVALRVINQQGSSIGVLRLAMPVDRTSGVSVLQQRVLRNAQAVAVSLAIGFSLLAAVLFVRPLQRVRAMVSALTAGDVSARVGKLGNDEVGDVGRALDQMAQALRRRLLSAGLGEALLSQLVEALPTACVVFEERGEVVAINGAARRMLRIEGQGAGQRMKELADNPHVLAAMQAAEDEGEPEPVELTLGDAMMVRGCVHVLKRPGTAPLRVFLCLQPPPEEPTLLPPAAAVQPRSLGEVLQLAESHSVVTLNSTALAIELLPPRFELMVADAELRLVRGLAEVLVVCAPAPGGTTPATPLRILVTEEPTRVRLHIPILTSEQTRARVRPLIEPLGGAIESDGTETDLWLPRA